MRSSNESSVPPNHAPSAEAIARNDYYAILGVPRTASEDDIKRAYRRLALQHHPDKVQDGDDRHLAETRFKAISAAYEVLKDKNARAQFDRFGVAGTSTASSQSGAYHNDEPFMQFHDPEQVFREFFGSSSPFGNLFSDMFDQQQSFQGMGFRPPFGSPMSGAFPGFPTMPPMMGMNGGSSMNSSFFSSSAAGNGGTFRSTSTRTQIVNGRRTTVQETVDETGRCETITTFDDGRQERRIEQRSGLGQNRLGYNGPSSNQDMVQRPSQGNGGNNDPFNWFRPF